MLDVAAPLEIVIGLVIGLGAGVVGGLAGIGGSIIMLPAVALVLGYSTQTKSEQHLYQAAAMWVNVVVAWSASRRHREHGVEDRRVHYALLPGIVLGIIAGVWLSDQLRGESLKLGLVVFLWLYCLYNGITAVTGLRRPRDPNRPRTPEYDMTRRRTARLAVIGAGTGVPAGLLGIGGGVIMVPLMQVWARLPLRRAIAASAAVMWVSALIGAAMKTWTLPQHDQSRMDVLMLALPMAAGAFVGSRVGAGLTHALRLPHLKLAISAILAVAGLRMIGVI